MIPMRPGASGSPQISSVMFGEGSIEISFLEPRDMNDWGLLAKTAVIHISEETAAEAAELRSAAEELLERWLTIRRNPPARFKGPPR